MKANALLVVLVLALAVLALTVLAIPVLVLVATPPKGNARAFFAVALSTPRPTWQLSHTSSEMSGQSSSTECILIDNFRKQSHIIG